MIMRNVDRGVWNCPSTGSGRAAFFPVMLSPGLRYIEGLSKHLLTLCTVLIITACGGGGGNGSTSPSTTISFSGTNPGSNSVYMAQNSALSSGDILAIDVKMNNLSSNAYGAAFDVDFDSTKMTYNSYAVGSFLEQGENTVNYQMGLQSGNSGKLVVGISRQGGVGGVSGSGTIVTLKFRVTGNLSVAFSNYGSSGICVGIG